MSLDKNRAVAETIENNIRKVIVDEQPVNPKYYEKMSELLKEREIVLAICPVLRGTDYDAKQILVLVKIKVNIDENIITVNELPVKVIRKKIKNLHLAVYPPDGWVRIAVPEIIDDEAVRLAVISKFGWIKRQIKLFENQPRQSARELITGESHYYLGRRYLLDVSYCKNRPSIELKNKKMLVLHVNDDTSLEQREQLLSDWYRKEMKRLLPGIIRKWEIKSSLKVRAYGIKRMKTKWGSCNPVQKRIWLNLELIRKPINCLEYVVVHEMVHFLERTHSDKFRSHMDRIMPQWRTFRDDLNRSSLAHENWKY